MLLIAYDQCLRKDFLKQKSFETFESLNWAISKNQDTRCCFQRRQKTIT